MSSIKRAAHRPLRRRLAVAGAITAGALLLAACGGDGDMAGMDHGGESRESSPTASGKAGAGRGPGAFNDADVAFAQGMIPHHQQAVEMSALAEGRASGAEIKALAGEIEKAQDPEITTMRTWLRAWGEPESAGEDMPGMDHGSGDTAGMMSDQDMRELTAAKGADFDKKFARLMIEHHNGAIAMARDERRNGDNAAARKLAADVIEAQTAEVEQLNAILDQL
ncbi:DUF305 domain-containing protein [Streptomyces niveus]|uniref:DUF305 domain-containing protein n=1 Tax=Streptomyces niveus TaxID=193462 RepID=A0A1U9QQ84_STRNV|nr:DUF305 domain-containing protein [Streptomyces niveus]AQU66438.1 DUF305 domain-containing protein [Streptomyces niveus]